MGVVRIATDGRPNRAMLAIAGGGRMAVAGRVRVRWHGFFAADTLKLGVSGILIGSLAGPVLVVAGQVVKGDAHPPPPWEFIRGGGWAWIPRPVFWLYCSDCSAANCRLCAH